MDPIGARSRSRRSWANRSSGPTLSVVVLVIGLLAAACAPVIRVPVFSSESPQPSVGAPVSAGPSGSAATLSQSPGVQAVAAFMARVSAGLSYHVAFTGSATASINHLPIVGGMDVSGEDFASSFTYDYHHDYQNLGTIPVQIRAVHGTGYARIGSGGWQTLKGYSRDESNAPFATVRSPADVLLGKVSKVGGRATYLVSIADAVLIHPNTIVGSVTNERIDTTKLDVLIDEAGRPISGTWHLDGQARVDGQLQEIVYDLKLTFSKVGAKISIARP